MSTQRHYEGATGARPEHGVLARRDYGLLAPEELAGDPAVAGSQGSGETPKDTMGTGGTDGREMGRGERNGQRASLMCVQSEDKDKEEK